jgi:hypothetical protein
MSKKSPKIKKGPAPRCPLCAKPVLGKAKNKELGLVVFIHAYEGDQITDGCQVHEAFEKVDLRTILKAAAKNARAN